MKRREFIAGLGGAVAWPLITEAQQSTVPVIGFLNARSAEVSSSLLAAFRQGLREERFIDGDNVAIQLHWADGQLDKLPTLARDFVNRGVAVIAAGSPPAAPAAKAATFSIPIVFTSGIDAVKLGLVPSLSRPGGNVTGISFLIDELTTKQLGLLHELVPQAREIGLLLNPNFYDVAEQFKDTQNTARAIGLKIEVLAGGTDDDIEAAFGRIAERPVRALIVSSDPFLLTRRERIIDLAARHRVATIYSLREYVTAGGLMSYDTSVTDAYRWAGVYVGRILKGEKPGDLPVVQPTKYEFVINLKTAKALGLTIPPNLLALADEVIE
jgi:putative tryptophan/tyrosine transport system substrate-binding protein